jgi:hypothetical protein
MSIILHIITPSFFTRLIEHLNFNNATKAAYTYSPTLPMNYGKIKPSIKFFVKRIFKQNQIFFKIFLWTLRLGKAGEAGLSRLPLWFRVGTWALPVWRRFDIGSIAAASYAAALRDRLQNKRRRLGRYPSTACNQ